jgi:hypothetical protein
MDKNDMNKDKNQKKGELNTPYWCWIGNSESSPPFVLVEAKQKDAIKTFKKEVSRCKGTGKSGTAVFLPDGRLMACGIGFEEADLTLLADYSAREEIKTLHHLRLVQLDHNGTVRAVFESSDLWPTPLQEIGSVELASAKIQALPHEASAWWWFGSEEETNHLLVIPHTLDKTPKLLKSQMRILASNFKHEPTQCLGILRKNTSGTFTLSSTANPKEWLPSFIAWFGQIKQDHPALSVLNNLRIAQVKDGNVIQVTRLDEHVAPGTEIDPSLRESFNRIAENSKVGFVFSNQQGLFISPEKKALREYFVSIESSSPIRGQIEKTDSGYFVFHLRQNGKGVLEQIAQWWKNNQGQALLPELAKSRLIQRDKEKNIVLRVKNDELWTTLK